MSTDPILEEPDSGKPCDAGQGCLPYVALLFLWGLVMLFVRWVFVQPHEDASGNPNMRVPDKAAYEITHSRPPSETLKQSMTPDLANPRELAATLRAIANCEAVHIEDHWRWLEAAADTLERFAADDGWLPMVEYPRDSRLRLLWAKSPAYGWWCAVGSWDAGTKTWKGWKCRDAQPTHFRPLPAPPSNP